VWSDQKGFKVWKTTVDRKEELDARDVVFQTLDPASPLRLGLTPAGGPCYGEDREDDSISHG